MLRFKHFEAETLHLHIKKFSACIHNREMVFRWILQTKALFLILIVKTTRSETRK